MPTAPGSAVPGRLSRDFSHLGKWILAPAWLIGCAYFTLLMFTDPGRVEGEGALPMPPAAKWIFLTVGAFGLWWMARHLLPLRRVELRGEALAVSGLGGERLIPLAEIRTLGWRFRPSWDQAGVVVIQTKAPGSRGQQIHFVPRSEAVVEELRALVAKTTGLRPEH